MHDIIHAETEANLVSEAMARMRSFVLAKGPLLMKTGGAAGGVSCPHLAAEEKAALVERLRSDRSYTYDDAARDYKLDRRTVFAYAKQAGIHRRRKSDPEKLREAVRLVTVTGITSYAAEKLTGIPRGTILKAIKS